MARTAERNKFDLLFLADGIGIRADDVPAGSLCRSSHNAELEPLTLLSAIAACTQRIGLVATASTTYNEPYHIARKYGSLDMISAGRAGWNVVTSWSEQEAWNFNRAKHLDYDTRYERAEEFVDVVTGLWDSWDQDAFVHDKHSSVFYDEGKLHVLNHVGKHFGAWPAVGQALAPGPADPGSGRYLRSRPADCRAALRHRLRRQAAHWLGPAVLRLGQDRLAGFGRRREDLLMMVGLTPIVGSSRAHAQEKYEQLQELINPLVGLAMLKRSFGDLSAMDLDGPVPAPNLENVGLRSSAQMYYETAQREGLSIRQLYKRIGMAQEHLTVVGTGQDVADQMEAWVDEEAADGFNIAPTHLPHGIDDFVEYVLPELRRRGRFREEYEGNTLRENLGLTVPKSRFA